MIATLQGGLPIEMVCGQLGDNQLGDNIWSTGRQIIKVENSIMRP